MPDPQPERLTRLQQLIEKSAAPDAALTEEDMQLDQRAGMFVQLTEEQNPAAIRKLLVEFLDLCRVQNVQPKTNLVPAAMAASLHTAEKLMESEKFPEARALEVMLKVSAVYGLRPAMFDGASTKELAEIMERDLDLPALEKSFARFGFAVKDGTIGAWNGPLPETPKPPQPPKQLG